MDKLTKLSEAIRYGSTFIKEGELFGVSRKGEFGCCAVGTAYLACFPNKDDDVVNGWQIMADLAQRFNVPLYVVMDVSNKHHMKQMNRAQCADWLEAQGY